MGKNNEEAEENMRAIVQILGLSAFCFLMGAGCAHQWSEPSGKASSNPLTPALQPTSDSDAQRVYSSTVTAPDGGQATLTRTQPGASAEDQQIAEAIRKMTAADPNLIPFPSKVAASMDPASKGTVVLSGWVPTKAAKKKLIDRVAELPGVTRVEDKLQINLAPNPGEFVPLDQNK